MRNAWGTFVGIIRDRQPHFYLSVFLYLGRLHWKKLLKWIFLKNFGRSSVQASSHCFLFSQKAAISCRRQRRNVQRKLHHRFRMLQAFQLSAVHLNDFKCVHVCNHTALRHNLGFLHGTYPQDGFISCISFIGHAKRAAIAVSSAHLHKVQSKSFQLYTDEASWASVRRISLLLIIWTRRSGTEMRTCSVYFSCQNTF